MRRGPALAALVFLFVLGEPALGTTISFQEGVDSGFGAYSGTEDTLLISVLPDTPQGTRQTSGMDGPGAGGGDGSHGLLRFTGIVGAGPGQIAPGSTVSTATLTLDFSPNSGPGGTIHFMFSFWDEDTETWNSYGSGVQTDDVEASSSGASIAASGLVVIDVTDDVQAWVGGSDNFGWAFMTTSTNGAEFHSSDAATPSTRPLLEVDFTPIPEPSTALLVWTGLLSLGLRRSSR